MRKALRTLLQSATGMAVFFLLLFAADRGMMLLYKHALPDIDTKSLGTKPDPVLGYREVANAHFAAHLKVEGEEIWQATYTTDSRGWRVTPGNDSPGARDRYAVFLGCSFTFGWGVNDDATLPNQFALGEPDYHVYNMAAMGYGAQQMVALLQSGEVAEVVQESRGIVVYVFFSGQFGRTVGDIRTVSRFAADFPAYAMKNGELRSLGPYAKAYPWRYACYSFLGNSGFVRYFELNYPLAASRSHCELLTGMVLEARRIALEELHADAFYVLVYPAAPDAQRAICAKVVPAFKEAGLTVFDYENLVDMTDTTYIYAPRYDAHPTPETHRIVAEQFMKDLDALEGTRGDAAARIAQ